MYPYYWRLERGFGERKLRRERERDMSTDALHDGGSSSHAMRYTGVDLDGDWTCYVCATAYNPEKYPTRWFCLQCPTVTLCRHCRSQHHHAVKEVRDLILNRKNFIFNLFHDILYFATYFFQVHLSEGFFCDECGSRYSIKNSERYRCLVCSDYDRCKDCFRAPRHPHDLAKVATTPKTVWFCDSCGRRSAPIRHRCGVCEDFDMCQTCAASSSSSTHTAPSIHPHPLKKVSYNLSHQWYCNKCHTFASESDNAPRYRCYTCDDFDLCAACRGAIHPHPLKEVTSPSSWQCGTCTKRLTKKDCRFRCGVCANFDVCVTCMGDAALGEKVRGLGCGRESLGGRGQWVWGIDVMRIIRETGET